jgi:hypothetical protein
MIILIAYLLFIALFLYLTFYKHGAWGILLVCTVTDLFIWLLRL